MYCDFIIQKINQRFCFRGLGVFASLLLAVDLSFGQPVQVGITHFPPLYVIDKQHVLSGILLDLMQRSLSRAGLDYKVQGYPPKRLYFGLAEGKVDLFIGLKGNPLYDDKVIYSANPVSYLELRIYAVAGQEIPHEAEQLLSQRIAIIRGYGYGGLRPVLLSQQNKPFVTELNTHKNALAMLESGRIRYLLDYKNPVEATLRENTFANFDYIMISKLPTYFIVSKASKNPRNLMQLLEASQPNPD